MHELMKKLQELADLFCVKLAKLNAEKEGISIEKSGLDIKEKELNDREGIIKQGEVKYKKAGDIAAYEESAKSLMNQARGERGILDDDQAKFKTYRETADNEIANEKALIVKRNNELAAGFTKLENDRGAYKKKVTDEITRNLK